MGVHAADHVGIESATQHHQKQPAVGPAGIELEHMRIIEPTPRNHEKNVKVLREELAHQGPSVIIARRSCLEAIKKRRD